VFHLGKSGQDYFYAMEFVEGKTLDSFIKRQERLEAKLALELPGRLRPVWRLSTGRAWYIATSSRTSS
jgi:hypothetical protein